MLNEYIKKITENLDSIRKYAFRFSIFITLIILMIINLIAIIYYDVEFFSRDNVFSNIFGFIIIDLIMYNVIGLNLTSIHNKLSNDNLDWFDDEDD